MKSEHAGSTVNLNLNASSRYVAIPANQVPGMNYPTGFAPPFMPFMNFGYSPNSMMKQAEYSEINDAFLLRTKIQELNQNLLREAEINKVNLVKVLFDKQDAGSKMSRIHESIG
jgi:hypothetical protein